MRQQSPRYHHYCLRVSLIPIGLILSFCVLLTTLDLLGTPVNPARNQHLGWQSWDVVRYPKAVKPVQQVVSPGSLTGSKPGDDSNETSDLFDGDDDDSTSIAPSLPLDNWDPLLPHATGISEITVMPCFFPPWIYPRLCSPPTTPEQDKLKGRWVRVERDLNVKSGLWYLNIYYRRTRRFDVPLINDIVLLPEGASPPGHINLSRYTMAVGDFRNGVWPKQDKLRLWYKTRAGNRPGLSSGAHYKSHREWSQWDTDLEEEEEEAAEGSDRVGSSKSTMNGIGTGGDHDEIITEIDVLYGENRPFWSFERVKNGPVVERKPNKWEMVDVVVRRGNPVTPLATPPRFSKEGKFKIMQIPDLHFSVSHGECRDTLKSPCVGDTDTIDLLSKMLDEEKPDMVVFTGDQLNGQDTSWDAKSVIAKVTGPIIDRKIPWTAIFGNHDSEILDDRAAQMKYMQALPYSLAEPGPADVDGVGNYIVKLYSHDASMMHLFTLYFLDSHARQKRKLPWVWTDYDYLKPNQIEWFLNTSSAIKPVERPFTSDGDDDLGKVWTRRTHGGGKTRYHERAQEKILAKPNAMMFFHIPLIESYEPIDVDEETGEEIDVGVQLGGDGPGSSKTNGRFFEFGLLQAPSVPPEIKDVDVSSTLADQHEVKVVAHGHCHNTDHCRRNQGIHFCFSGGVSYDAYGREGFDRRTRFYELSDYGETISTFKRTEHDENVDKQLLVSGGVAMSLKLLD